MCVFKCSEISDISKLLLFNFHLAWFTSWVTGLFPISWKKHLQLLVKRRVFLIILIMTWSISGRLNFCWCYLTSKYMHLYINHTTHIQDAIFHIIMFPAAFITSVLSTMNTGSTVVVAVTFELRILIYTVVSSGE